MVTTVHINFVNSKKFVEKNRISGLYLDFFYYDDFYQIYHAKYGLYNRKDLLATLYASDVSLMEGIKYAINSNSPIRFRTRVPLIIHNTLFVSESSQLVR